ncbi:MAG: cytochrome D1 domain-containing protein [Rhodospirillaceae bacterium]
MKRALVVALISLTLTATAHAEPDAAGLFASHCAACHGTDRLGGRGPALLPESLGRLTGSALTAVIAAGRPGTGMTGFADQLAPEALAALGRWLQTTSPAIPDWGLQQMLDSRQILRSPASLPDRPVHTADPLNLFVVVETGDSHITILDGDRFEPLARLPSHFALHGGPKFAPDGRFVYLASRDGWISKVDLHALATVAEIRVGFNTRNLAISSDGKVLAVGNLLPQTLVLLDAADLTPLKVIAVADRSGKTPSRISAVYQAAPRNSFVVALKDVAELWEVSWLEQPPPVHPGLVHSYEKGMEEKLPLSTGRFPIRRIELKQPLDDFFFDPGYHHLVGSARGGGAVVVNLEVGAEIATLSLPGLPHLGSGITWSVGDRPVMASPNLREGVVSIIDIKSWVVTNRIDTLGPGFFLRSHENTPYAWADCSMSPARDTLQILDKQTLTVVRTLRPEPGKTASHVEFSRDGRFALVSIAEPEGWLVVYDAATFEEVKRLPMRKPSGKYNVFNKITLSSGTSH